MKASSPSISNIYFKYIPVIELTVSKTAKVFMNGRSQVVRLPREFRFDCDEVFIRRDPDTGDVIISEKPVSWDGFFELLKHTPVSDDFISDREDTAPQPRDPFE